jgi:hypothetical protein
MLALAHLHGLRAAALPPAHLQQQHLLRAAQVHVQTRRGGCRKSVRENAASNVTDTWVPLTVLNGPRYWSVHILPTK